MLPKGDQQFYIRITLAKDAEFKFVVWDEWHGWTQVDQNSTVVTNGSIVQGSDPDSTGYRIKAAVAGTYEVYFKNNYDSGKIWIQQDAETEASAFATTFLATITCTSTSTTFDISAWNHSGSETASMEYKYSQLTEGARGLLTIADADQGGSVIEQCAARYDRILGKYGYGTASGQYHDFMGRTPARIGSSAVIVNLNNKTTTNSVIVVVVVSITAIAVAGFFFFFYKKKNQ